MFWGLASGEVDTRQFEFEHVLRDIQTLNEWAIEGKLEVTAISLAAYPFVQERYVLLPHGASMGAGYGPIVVAREELSVHDLRDVEVPARVRAEPPDAPVGVVRGERDLSQTVSVSDTDGCASDTNALRE